MMCCGMSEYVGLNESGNTVKNIITEVRQWRCAGVVFSQAFTPEGRTPYNKTYKYSEDALIYKLADHINKHELGEFLISEGLRLNRNSGNDLVMGLWILPSDLTKLNQQYTRKKRLIGGNVK